MESTEHINFCMLEAQHCQNHHQKHRMDVQAREKFAEVISQMRGDRSYRSFAKFLGVSHPTIKAWENLEGIPDKESLERVASLRAESLEEFKEFLEGSRQPSRLQNLLQQVRTIPEDELAVVLRVIADRIENS